ncbi:histidine phosphatase family protein [Streptomyces cynarae]|uniref:Histidine phosphatase family protein n=1 Tax=Streptomyces cynarae TaxID=2981134 RepID=A0ABY6DTA7_9ACTN|nr:histidine phosphatase family protein [Streptomyces cynarae]UXY17599.1 histidine phosphatase family protein [Streptomyces cynarae]
MTIRLILVTPALGPVAPQVPIDGDVPLDARARQQARDARGVLPPADRYLCAPSRRCTQTAEAFGLEALTEPALRDLELDSWKGRSLDELAATEPEALAAWTTDPTAAPHGGEAVTDLCRRVADWLDGLPDDTGRLLAVADQSVARAAVVHALMTPAQAFWRIDVPPLTCVQLTGRSGRWNLRMR